MLCKLSVAFRLSLQCTSQQSEPVPRHSPAAFRPTRIHNWYRSMPAPHTSAPPLRNPAFARGLLENVFPGRCKEYAGIVAEKLHSPFHVLRNRKLHQSQIPGNIRYAAVEENTSRQLLCDVVRAHLPGEHVLGKCCGIAPRQRATANRDLILDDAAPGF